MKQFLIYNKPMNEQEVIQIFSPLFPRIQNPRLVTRQVLPSGRILWIFVENNDTEWIGSNVVVALERNNNLTYQGQYPQINYENQINQGMIAINIFNGDIRNNIFHYLNQNIEVFEHSLLEKIAYRYAYSIYPDTFNHLSRDIQSFLNQQVYEEVDLELHDFYLLNYGEAFGDACIRLTYNEPTPNNNFLFTITDD
jgi:hypothetical protein